MARQNVRYLDIDVLTAAKDRARHVIRNYDKYAVAFSGGKDSLVVVTIMRAVMDEMGITKPLDLFFQDEELIPDDVIEFVQAFRKRPEFNLHYFAVPMKSHQFVMGESRPYTQWDPNRKWIRPKPDFAVTQLHPDGLPLDQHEIPPYEVKHVGWRGKVAVLTGIRADESMTRFAGCVAKKGPLNYIAGGSALAPNIEYPKIIFDWSQRDVFKFFHDYKVPYCHIYDVQNYGGSVLRVATPLHEAGVAKLPFLRACYPKFYEQLISIWPETATQERYWLEVDRFGVVEKYPKTWEGIIQYVEEHIDDGPNRRAAMAEIVRIRAHKERNKREVRYVRGDCFGFPLLYVFRAIVSGRFNKKLPFKTFPSPEEAEYEKEHLAITGGASVQPVSSEKA